MPVPAVITAQVAALNAAIGAAGDLNAATFKTLNALAFQAGTTAQAIEDAIDSAAGALDTFAASIAPQDTVKGVLTLLDSANTQATLSDLEGYVARVEINLESLMATAAQPFLARAPATRVARVSNTTLFRLAATYYGDPLLWTLIAEANGTSDPWVTPATQIIIPDAPPQASAPTGLLIWFVAIAEGVAPHRAWIIVDGTSYLVLEGSVDLVAKKRTGTFSAKIPLTQKAESALANLGDNTASIKVQTNGRTATLITGEVDNTSFDFVHANTITLTGRDVSAKLHNKKSSEEWINKKPDEIITDLAGRVGLSTEIDPVALKAGKLVEIDWTKLSDNISYAMIIHKLAEFMGAHWYVKGGTLFVRTGASSGSPYQIRLREGQPMSGDVLSLVVNRNVQAGKGILARVVTWNPHQKKAYIGEHHIGGNGTPQEFVYHFPGLDQAHVNQHAIAKAHDHSRHETTVEATCVGDPTIDIGDPLQLTGTAFAGTYKTDHIVHRFGMSGHTMNIVAKKKVGR